MQRLAEFARAVNAKSPVFFSYQQLLNAVIAGGIPAEMIGCRYHVQHISTAGKGTGGACGERALAFMLARPRIPKRGNGPRAGKARRLARAAGRSDARISQPSSCRRCKSNRLARYFVHAI